MDKMRQAKLISPEVFIIEEAERPSPRSGEVSISVRNCGICGSDIHAYFGKHPFMPCPLVMGHEFAGVIEKIGNGVSGLEIGENVTVEPLLVCDECYNCKTGRYNICSERKVLGCQSPGAYAESITVPADKVIKLPDGMDFEVGAAIEPGAVAVHAVRRMGDIRNNGVVVIGAGPIGLMVAQVASAFGAGRVMIADLDSFRISMADKIGIDYAVDTSRKSLKESIKDVFGPDGPDIWFECVGSGKVFDQILELARPGTKVSSIGISSSSETLTHLASLSEHELNVVGSSVYMREDFEITIDLISNKKIAASEMITHRYPIADTGKAFQMIADKQPYVKVMLVAD